MSDDLQARLSESVQEGLHRLRRTWPSLLATGFVGGVDVSVGVFAMLLVKTNDGNDILAALAFSIGFIAIAMAGSELFTENFLMPINAVVIGRASWREVGRLWTGTAVMNVVGGLVVVVLMMAAFPDLGEEAVASGEHFIEVGLLRSFLSAVLAGIVITLMTWMMLRKPVGSKIVAAVVAAFVLNYGQLHHVVVASLEIFAGLFADAPYGLIDWVPLFVVMALGNMVGGIGLVTVSRLIQLGGDRVEQERVESELRDKQEEAQSPRGVLLDPDPTPLEERESPPSTIADQSLPNGASGGAQGDGTTPVGQSGPAVQPPPSSSP